ncbi:MAG: AAA family ATPase [Chitinophagales bacterium]
MSNHITEIEVKNFKKFDHLSVENIGQFNLITGDNNVGKTTLLESLLIDENVDYCIENLHRILCNRLVHIHPKNIHSNNPVFPSDNYFDYLKNKNTINDIEFNWKNKNSVSFNYKFQDVRVNELNENDFQKEKKHNYKVGRPNLWIRIFKDGILDEIQFMYLDDFKRDLQYGYLPMIYKNTGFNLDVVQFYSEIIGLNEGESLTAAFLSRYDTSGIKSLNYEQKVNFIKYLSLFYEDIEDINIRDYRQIDILCIKLKRFEDYVPITFLGDGINEFIRYILEIQKCKDKHLMIDEVGTGIHHSKLAAFWKIILQVANNEDVQLFATTHSQECIDAFAKAADELGEDFSNDIRLIELEESKKSGKIYASTFSYDNIKTGLISNYNFRG